MLFKCRRKAAFPKYISKGFRRIYMANTYSVPAILTAGYSESPTEDDKYFIAYFVIQIKIVLTLIKRVIN